MAHAQTGAFGVNLNSDAYHSKNPYSPTYEGQCTWYVWGRVCEKTGITMTWRTGDGRLGNAFEWPSCALATGYTVGTQPKTGAVAVDTSYQPGHVMYVEAVSGNMMYVSEANLKGVSYTEGYYNLSTGVYTNTLQNISFQGGSYSYHRPLPDKYIYLPELESPTIDVQTEGTKANITWNDVGAESYYVYVEVEENEEWVLTQEGENVGRVFECEYEYAPGNYRAHVTAVYSEGQNWMTYSYSDFVILDPTTPEASILQSGICGSDMTWSVFSDGSLIIGGTGEMNSWSSERDVPWNGYAISSVMIEEGVTSIGNRAFSHCDSLRSISIPKTVTRIGDSAFSGCYKLTKLVLRGTVTSIGNYAFANCEQLVKAILPDSITSIGDYAFLNCKCLEEFRIPANLEQICEGTFAHCSRLIGVIIPENVISIGELAFSNCIGLMGLTIPDQVTTIGNQAFLGCTGLTNISLSSSLVRISNCMFKGCTGLMNIVIPDGVEEIGDIAFRGCSSLESVSIPASLTSIGEYAFYDCSSLKTINYGGTETRWRNVAIASGNGPLNSAAVHCIMITGNTLVLPGTLTAIGSEAFVNLPEIEIICIPSSVTDIAVDAFDPNVTIQAPAGSYAVGWARENRFRYFIAE